MVSFNLYNLQNNTYGEFLIPWVFVFAMIYGLLGMSNIFKNNKVNALISGAIAFFATAAPEFRSILWDVMPWGAAVLIIVALAKVLIEVSTSKKDGGKSIWETLNNLHFVVFGLAIILVGTLQNKINIGVIDVDEILWALGFGIVGIAILIAARQTETGVQTTEVDKGE